MATSFVVCVNRGQDDAEYHFVSNQKEALALAETVLRDTEGEAAVEISDFFPKKVKLETKVLLHLENSGSGKGRPKGPMKRDSQGNILKKDEQPSLLNQRRKNPPAITVEGSDTDADEQDVSDSETSETSEEVHAST